MYSLFKIILQVNSVRFLFLNIYVYCHESKLMIILEKMIPISFFNNVDMKIMTCSTSFKK